MKKVLFAIVSMIILCVGNVFAQETDVWDIALDGPAFYESGQSLALRKIIFAMLCVGMFISVLLALFKKISLSWFLGLLSWTAIFITAGIIEDFVDKEEYLFNNLGEGLLWFMVFVIVALLPIFIPLLQYKFKKIDKKLLKHRLFIWSICGLLFGLCIGVLVIFI